MGKKQPAAREDALQLTLVEIHIDEDLGADQPIIHVHQAFQLTRDHVATAFLDPAGTVGTAV